MDFSHHMKNSVDISSKNHCHTYKFYPRYSYHKFPKKSFSSGSNMTNTQSPALTRLSEYYWSRFIWLKILTKSRLSFTYKMIWEIISVPRVDSGYPHNFEVDFQVKYDKSKLKPKSTVDECVHSWNVRNMHNVCSWQVV